MNGWIALFELSAMIIVTVLAARYVRYHVGLIVDRSSFTASHKQSLTARGESFIAGFTMFVNTDKSRTVNFFGPADKIAVIKRFFEEVDPVYSGVVIPWLAGAISNRDVYKMKKDASQWYDVHYSRD